MKPGSRFPRLLELLVQLHASWKTSSNLRGRRRAHTEYMLCSSASLPADKARSVITKAFWKHWVKSAIKAYVWIRLEEKEAFQEFVLPEGLNKKDGMTFVFFYAPDNDLQQREALIILHPWKIILTNTFRRHLHHAKLLKFRPCWFNSSTSIYIFIF